MTEPADPGAPALDPAALAEISRRTRENYDLAAARFWEATRDHDVSQNIAALLEALEGPPPLRILDLGCGPGRDLVAFTRLGHVAIGLEGSGALAAMARAHSGCEVWQQDFLRFELPPASFDGVFANASLQHVPRQELPRVLVELHAALKPRGVLFSSVPHGPDDEGWYNGRYSNRLSLPTWRRCAAAAGFVELRHYFRPAGRPREQQPWLACVWRKAGGPAPVAE